MDSFGSWSAEPFNMSSFEGPLNVSLELAFDPLLCPTPFDGQTPPSSPVPLHRSSYDFTNCDSIEYMTGVAAHDLSGARSPTADLGPEIPEVPTDEAQPVRVTSNPLLITIPEFPPHKVLYQPQHCDVATAPARGRRPLGRKDGDSSSRRCCPIPGCNRSYVYKRDLKHHMKRKHPECEAEAIAISRPRSTKTNKPFVCYVPECPSGFKHKRDLLRHILAKHADNLTGDWGSPEFLASVDSNLASLLTSDDDATRSHQLLQAQQQLQRAGVKGAEGQSMFCTFAPSQKPVKVDFQDYDYETHKFEKRIED